MVRFFDDVCLWVKLTIQKFPFTQLYIWLVLMSQQMPSVLYRPGILLEDLCYFYVPLLGKDYSSEPSKWSTVAYPLTKYGMFATFWFSLTPLPVLQKVCREEVGPRQDLLALTRFNAIRKLVDITPEIYSRSWLEYISFLAHRHHLYWKKAHSTYALVPNHMTIPIFYLFFIIPKFVTRLKGFCH